MDSRTSSMRPVMALAMPDIKRAEITPGSRPKFVDVPTSSLLVDERYQRNLSEKSVRLIRKIVEDWDWCRFKPLIVVHVPPHYHVIDGQHTAIAAASHGGLETIPVMIVDAPDVAGRAIAFVGHNRDRIGITPLQIHYAEVAAGDPAAIEVQHVCDKAGAKLLKMPPTQGVFLPGDTMAISTIKSLVAQKGVMGARQVLQTLVSAKCAPISADLIKATAALLLSEEYRGTITSDDLATWLSSLRRGDHAVDLAARLEVVEEENNRLRERIAALEKTLFASDIRLPIEWRLTISESRLVGALLAREIVTRETAMHALYAGRVDDDPDITIIDVFLCKVRKKLRPFGVSIRTILGRGYALDPDVRSRLRASSPRREGREVA